MNVSIRLCYLENFHLILVPVVFAHLYNERDHNIHCEYVPTSFNMNVSIRLCYLENFHLILVPVVFACLYNERDHNNPL